MEHKQPLEDPEVQAPKKRRSGFSDGPIDAEATGGELPSIPEHDNALSSHETHGTTGEPQEGNGHENHSVVVNIPQKEVPYVNFVELLRSESATLRAIESDTGCQIILKGSEFEKQNVEAAVEMHILVTGTNTANLASAKSQLESFLADERVR
eukprot:31686_3